MSYSCDKMNGHVRDGSEMAVQVREYDGQGGVLIESKGDSVFLVGQGFTMEFDAGIWRQAMRQEFGMLQIFEGASVSRERV